MSQKSSPSSDNSNKTLKRLAIAIAVVIVVSIVGYLVYMTYNTKNGDKKTNNTTNSTTNAPANNESVSAANSQAQNESTGTTDNNNNTNSTTPKATSNPTNSQSTKQLKYYTNELFPGIKLAYYPDWKVEVESSMADRIALDLGNGWPPEEKYDETTGIRTAILTDKNSVEPNTMNYTLKLSKLDPNVNKTMVLQFDLSAIFNKLGERTCGSGPTIEYEEYSNNVAKIVGGYDTPTEKNRVYLFGFKTLMSDNSTIPCSFYTTTSAISDNKANKLLEPSSKNGKLEYNVTINLFYKDAGAEKPAVTSETATFKELTEMVKNSTFN